MAHIYYMTQRPAGPGAQPREGLVNVEALNRSDVIPSIGKCAYARLTYDRELTAQEIIGFELTPEVYKMRYIIAYQAGPHMETFAAEMAATPEEAAAQFQAKHPERVINSVRQADENARWMYGYGSMTDEEKAEHKERFAAKMAASHAAAEEVKEWVATYEPDEFAARIAYQSRRDRETTQNAEGVHIGDLFSAEWGYDQTNVNYFQVIALKGAHTIVVRELATRRKEVLDTMTGYSRPIRDSFRDDAQYTLRTRLDSDGGSGPRPRGRLIINAPRGYGSLCPYTDGTVMHFTAYA